MRQCSGHSDPREDAQSKIPVCHRPSPVPRRPVSHSILSHTNEQPIQDTRCNGDHGMSSHPVQDRDGIIFLFKSDLVVMLSMKERQCVCGMRKNVMRVTLFVVAVKKTYSSWQWQYRSKRRAPKLTPCIEAPTVDNRNWIHGRQFQHHWWRYKDLKRQSSTWWCFVILILHNNSTMRISNVMPMVLWCGYGRCKSWVGWWGTAEKLRIPVHDDVAF